ncbi:MAG: sphinganine kinase lcb4 [Candelina mexicana]|nr:MAG: sphinganine kinase lcb4 [Candelina mexicana]
MDSSSSINDDPFVDPSLTDQPVDSVDDLTLSVGRNAFLTLGTDRLIVLDESFVKDESSHCCGLISNGSKTTRAIPFYNILWSNLSTFDLTIHYAQLTSKNVVRAAIIAYAIEKSERAKATTWIVSLLNRAYGESQRRKRIKVLINPFGGKGSAQKWYNRDIEPIFTAARCELSVERTQFQGHAVEIAENLEVNAFDVIASCSGDGLPHEVFNGLGKKKNAWQALSQIAVVQLPCGSGNAMSWNLNGTDSPSLAALYIVKGIQTPLDLISITQGNRRTLSFLSQAVGVVAESDLGTENLRWMGSARFTYGFLVRLLGKTVYPCDVAVKMEIGDKSAIREHYRHEVANPASSSERRKAVSSKMVDSSSMSEIGDGLPTLDFGTVNDDLPTGWHLLPYDKLGNFYAGNMAYMAPNAVFFPATLPNDGFLDLVTVDGDISRRAAIQSLLAVEKGTFFEMPHVNYRKIVGYRWIPKGQRDGFISIDGERFPFEPFQAEVHRGLGTVLSKSGHLYEARGVA